MVAGVVNVCHRQKPVWTRQDNPDDRPFNVDSIESLQEKPYAVPYKLRGNKCRFGLIFVSGQGASLSRVCGFSPAQLEFQKN
jgi:hypothetical protein